MAITTHVLDTSLGRPAVNVGITLEQLDHYGQSRVLAETRTDGDGRARDLTPPDETLEAGRYRLHFDAGAYFMAAGRESFYPTVTVTFEVRDASQHYHVALLLSPFGYSTYRGS